jgi:hypothetical protein
METIRKWFINHYKKIAVVVIILFGVSIHFHRDMNLSETELKGGIQNRLVWSIKGECFFVRPSSVVSVNQNVVLVRVEDCDKK